VTEGAHEPARKRKIVQLAVNQAQLFVLCDDGAMFAMTPEAPGEWTPMDVRIVETGHVVYPGPPS
jgi:hypothetical protein